MGRRGDLPHADTHDFGGVQIPERILWRAVILEALRNATHVGTNIEEYDVWHCREWFRCMGKDFRMVCDLADMDAVEVSMRALAYIAADDVKREEKRKLREAALKAAMESQIFDCPLFVKKMC